MTICCFVASLPPGKDKTGSYRPSGGATTSTSSIINELLSEVSSTSSTFSVSREVSIISTNGFTKSTLAFTGAGISSHADNRINKNNPVKILRILPPFIWFHVKFCTIFKY